MTAIQVAHPASARGLNDIVRNLNIVRNPNNAMNPNDAQRGSDQARRGSTGRWDADGVTAPGAS